MKRASDGNNSAEKRSNWASASSSETSSDSERDAEKQSEKSTSKDPQTNSKSTSLPSTSTQSFPYYGYSGSEFFNVDSNQNSYMMPFARNCLWPDNSMFGMTLPNQNSQLNSSGIPFVNNNVQIPTTGTSNMNMLINPSNPINTNPIRSPSPTVAFSKEEVKNIIEQMEGTPSLRDVLRTLIKWLDRGECTKNTSDDFFTMMLTAHKQVWRLMLEKSAIKETLSFKKKEVFEEMGKISKQFQEICKVIEMTKKQKVWDQFTKPQRKQLAVFFEEAEKLKTDLLINLEELEEQENDNTGANSDSTADILSLAEKEEHQKLLDELDSLRNQVTALEEENKSLKHEEKADTAMRQCNISNVMTSCTNLDSELSDLKQYKEKLESVPNGIVENGTVSDDCQKTSATNLSSNVPRNIPNGTNPSSFDLSTQEVRVIALVGNFLNVHPNGASIDYICSYLENVIRLHNIDSTFIEGLLKKLPNVFEQKSEGVGVSIRKHWYFLGFSS